MLRKVLFAGVLAVLLMPVAAQAQFNEGDWELTLGGSGSSDNDFVTNNFSAGGSLGYFFTDAIEGQVRQNVTIADSSGSDDDWNGVTRVALDYHFDADRWQPFIGAQLGYAYGDTTNDTWIAGPEGGVKYFVNSTTFIFGLVEYQFFFEDSDDASDAFDDGAFVYNLGIGFRW